jgi:hypothetical protein
LALGHNYANMKIVEFTSTRRKVQRKEGLSTYFYLDSHLTKNPDDHIKIELIKDDLCLLEIENQCYKGNLEELEEILWKWYSEDCQH